MTMAAMPPPGAAPPLTPGTEARLHGLVDALARWNPTINLVAASTLPEAWSRHVADSLQLLPLMPPQARTWVDLGSGGGFPGLVIAIAAQEAAPYLVVTLVEADQRKAAFLRETARRLDVSVMILAERIEHLSPLGADVVSARALAPLDRLWVYAERHLAPQGVGLFLKGPGAEAEVAAARALHGIDVSRTPSQTGTGSVILRVQRMKDD